VGLGTSVSSIQTDFRQGAFLDTGNNLDVAIVGDGFFQAQDTDGKTVFTRAGNFSRNKDGDLVLGSAAVGRLLQPAINIPEGAKNVSIAMDGQVTYMLAGDSQPQSAGQLEVATFINPEGLLKKGENIFEETDASGTAQPTIPGQEGAGTLRSGMLEASNVNPVRELIDLITTQRSFELNSQAVQAGDQVLQLVANLRRY
jgi:flagellar basal-body rod protein FlgG